LIAIALSITFTIKRRLFARITHLELFVAFSKVNNQLVSSFKHDGIIKETRGGNSNFDVILPIFFIYHKFGWLVYGV
jgi:hypothetical protein